MKEFARKGYRNASTDMIVKDSAISKGALFHYFKNKKGLFLYLYDYAIDIVRNEIMMKFNADEKDIFARRRQAAMLKIETLNRHPGIYDFMSVAYLEDNDEVKMELEARNKQAIANSRGFMTEGIDTSKFRDGIDIHKAVDIITWAVEGLINKETERIKRCDPGEINLYEMMETMDVYLEILKSGFYK